MIEFCCHREKKSLKRYKTPRGFGNFDSSLILPEETFVTKHLALVFILCLRGN